MPAIKKHLKYNWQLYVLFLPSFIWIIMFVFIPFFSNIIMSLEDYNTTDGLFGSRFVGLQNYKDFFLNKDFFTSFEM